MSRFNYNSVCFDPKLCKRIMTRFVSEASDMTAEVEIDDLIVEVKKPVKLYKSRNGFCAYVECPVITIDYDFKELAKGDVGCKEFRHNVIMRDPSMNGFSNLTLSLLHELGHFETESKVPCGYNRDKAEKLIDERGKGDYTKINLMYFNLPDEWLATQWAIEWLSNTENRKKAKQFEREFFKAWRGE